MLRYTPQVTSATVIANSDGAYQDLFTAPQEGALLYGAMLQFGTIVTGGAAAEFSLAITDGAHKNVFTVLESILWDNALSPTVPFVNNPVQWKATPHHMGIFLPPGWMVTCRQDGSATQFLAIVLVTTGRP